jgi:hypothetical protein
MGEVINHPSRWIGEIRRATREGLVHIEAMRMRDERFNRAAKFTKTGVKMALIGGAMMAAGTALTLLHIHPIGGVVLVGNGAKALSEGLFFIGGGLAWIGVLATTIGFVSAVRAARRFRRRTDATS